MPNDLIPSPRAEVARQEHSTPLEMLRQAITSREVPPEMLPQVLSAFFDFQLKVSAVNAEKEFNSDFSQALAEMPRVAKHGRKEMKEKGVIMYATYEDLDKAIRPIETKYGFSRFFVLRPGERGLTMELTLTHKGGHTIKSVRPCPPDPGPARNEIQAQGSGESYARRYMTLAIWNIVTVGADDDANSADPISEEQALKLREMLDHLAPTPNWYAGFWRWVWNCDEPTAEQKQPEAIQRKDLERVRAKLTAHVKAQRGTK
jgi:hypothetical protein